MTHEVLGHLERDGQQLLCVGADNLLHDVGQVIVLRLPQDLQQLQSDRLDVGLQVLLGYKNGNHFKAFLLSNLNKNSN